jgi:hypothetical protein
VEPQIRVDQVAFASEDRYLGARGLESLTFGIASSDIPIGKSPTEVKR